MSESYNSYLYVKMHVLQRARVDSSIQNIKSICSFASGTAYCIVNKMKFTILKICIQESVHIRYEAWVAAEVTESSTGSQQSLRLSPLPRASLLSLPQLFAVLWLLKEHSILSTALLYSILPF